jgi:hypothetical protein
MTQRVPSLTHIFGRLSSRIRNGRHFFAEPA